MVAAARRQSELDGRQRRQWPPKQLLGCAAPGPSLERKQEYRDRDGGGSKGCSEDVLCRREDSNGNGWLVENKIEMEPKVEAVRKNIKGLFLVEQNCLKKFTIPKKTPDKDFLTECSANQRDYNEIKQCLNENCLDIQCNLESLWQFNKIEMIHNKDLEEEFVAKRTKLREEGKQDKELSSFLVVSKDEVSQICQSGLCTGHFKGELAIAKELGNPQLGVYLFRYVDIALNYASKHSVSVESIIIFKVLLGKVKKHQPPKGQRKVALDPTPNFDCHMSRIHPSLKDSLEDQAIGSLVYFYEYNELSKPVNKPRQCLPYAVIQVQSVNQKRGADSSVTSLKCGLKRLPRHMGRVAPLENCTRVTRIGRGQLIYEHFRKPFKMCVSADISSSSFSQAQNWNNSEAKINGRGKKCNSTRRWDSAQIETNIQFKSGVEASNDNRGEQIEDGKKNNRKINLEDSSECEAGTSTVTTSRLIKDPRLTKREQNMGKQNEELAMKPSFSDDVSISTCKQSLKGITSIQDKHDEREVHNWFQKDISRSEIKHSIPPDPRCATNNCTSSKIEHSGKDNFYNVQDPIFQSAICRKICASEKNCICGWSSNEMTSGNFEKSKLPALKILNLKSKSSNMAETHKKTKDIHSVSEKASNSSGKREDYTVNGVKENSTKKIDNVESIRYQLCDTCLTGTVISDPNEKSMCLSKPESMDKNIFWNSRNCISSGIFIDEPKKGETKNIVDTRCFNELHVNQLEEESPCEKNGKRCNSAVAGETALKNIAEPFKDLKQCIETPDNSDTLDKKGTGLVFNLSVQESPLTQTQLTNREYCKEKFEELHGQTLHPKCVHLTGNQKEKCAVLLTSIPVSLGNMENAEMNKPPSENTASSNTSSEALNKNLFCRQVPEMFEQDLEIKCVCLNICGLDSSKENENTLEECKKSLSVRHKPFNNVNMYSGENEYHYLQERLDWENLFGKPNLNIKVSGSPALNTNEGNGEKSGEEEETELFNTFSCPDLQITITNRFQSKSESETRKRSTRCSVPRKCVSLSKCLFKKARPSEKHIQNILKALNNTETLLCKNKHPSQRIITAMFHLRKARKCVQHLKTGRKTPRGALWKANRHLNHESLSLNSSEISGCNTDIPCSTDNAKDTRLTETVSEKCTSLDSTDVKNISDEQIMFNKNRIPTEVSSGNVQEKSQESVIAAMENIKQSFSSDANSYLSKATANHFNITTKRKELAVCQRAQIKETFKSDTRMNAVKIATLDQATLESVAKVNVFQPDDTSGPYPSLIVQKTTISNERETLEVPSLQQENMILGIGCSRAPSAYLSLIEEECNAKTYEVPLTPEIYSNGPLSLKTTSSNSSIKHIDVNSSETLSGSFSGQKQKADTLKNKYLKSEHCCLNTFNQATEQKLGSAENRKCKPLSKSVKQPGNNAEIMSFNGYLPPISLVDNLDLSSHCCVLEKQKGENVEETEISETQTDFSAIKSDMIHDIPTKPFKQDFGKENVKQTSHVTLEESTCRQISSDGSNNFINLQLNSLLTAASGQDGETITETILPPACYNIKPNKTNQYFTRSKMKENENCFPDNSSDIYSDLNSNSKLSELGVYLKSLDFNFKISEILQKSDKTSSLNILHEQISSCRSILPLFIKAFEQKQGCSFEHVLVSRKILGSVKRNMQVTQKLEPCAIEALVELQIIMETIEFIENKKRFLEGEPTFRSLLWYDDSMYSELFGGHSGYQQQSNFFPAFQRRLKYNPLNELQIYHKQLVEAFENTISENNSYYSFLKLRREIKECESVVKQISNLSDFFLSVPFFCGANFGDSIEDLENSRKSTMELINISKSLPGMSLSAEKDHHLWIIMEIIGQKIEFIKTCEDINIKISLFGLEHIFFDSAKSLILKERNTFFNVNLKDGKGMLRINEVALSKLYEIYEHMIEESGNGNKNSTFGRPVIKNLAEESCNCEEAGLQQKTNCYISKSLILHQGFCCISEILDEAQSADIERLQQLMCRCTEHTEMLKKYFQIVQEEDVTVLITQENVLDFMKNGGINPVILKPEATEVYTELAMIYETVCFLKNSIAKQVDKPRFRSLLYFDLSLLPELFQCQEKMALLSFRKDNLLKTIESSISELQDELNVVYDYAENLNCSYALHLFTRELAELSETRSLLKTPESPVSMCVDLVPYAISLNYGTTVSELDCNYNQFSSLLEKLMLAEKKDLGKMAHIMKVMKTIEHMKFICSKQGKSPLPVVIHQMLKNWRKTCQLKQQLTERQLDRSEDLLQSSQTLHKRPFNDALEDKPSSSEDKIDLLHYKKKKVTASLMTTTKVDEKEISRNMRKNGKYNFSEDEEQQLKIPTDTRNRKIGKLRERSPVTFSQLKSAYPFECIHTSLNSSECRINNTDPLPSQQSLSDIKNVKEKGGQSAKGHYEEYFSSYSDPVKCISVSSVEVPQSPKDSLSSVEKLGEGSLLLATKNVQLGLETDVLGNGSDLQSEVSRGIGLPSGTDTKGEKSEIANYLTTFNSDSSVKTEINKSMELQSWHSTKPFYSDVTQNSAECSASHQNEYLGETSQMQDSGMHIYRSNYPYYSWYFYQTGRNFHSVSQTYQELNSYEIHPLNPAVSVTTSIVNSTHSSRFYTQMVSHFAVGESQNFISSQTYPVHGYFSSVVAYPYSFQQQPTWYAENCSHATFSYPSNIGL